MHIVRQAQLLSFLDWNRDNGREFEDLKKIGAKDRDRYDELVTSYAATVGIDSGTPEFEDVQNSTWFDALVDPDWPNGGRMLVDEAMSLAQRREPAPYQLAARYQQIPNRAYLFMTDLDGTLRNVINQSLDELSGLAANHLDVIVLRPSKRNQSAYELFSTTYLYRKSKAMRADIPFFLLYSSKGFVRIDNHKGHFEVYYLRQLFRALPDEFEKIQGPATQRQLDEIAGRLRALSASPLAKRPEPKKVRRIRWGWIATLVTMGAGLSTILANFDSAKATACSWLENVNLEFCTVQADEKMRVD